MALLDSRRPISPLTSRRLVLGVPFGLAAGTACAQEGELTFPHSSLVVATAARDIKFEVELALDDAHRSRGLMFRKQLGPYEGMLFDFFQEIPVSFWMKNTLIPLDMLFIAADGTIADFHERAVPESLEAINSDRPVAAWVPRRRRSRNRPRSPS